MGTSALYWHSEFFQKAYCLICPLFLVICNRVSLVAGDIWLFPGGAHLNCFGLSEVNPSGSKRTVLSARNEAGLRLWGQWRVEEKKCPPVPANKRQFTLGPDSGPRFVLGIK